ncbi:Hypothetical protein, putative [Bodo saltans]|uniref:Uncharacterized protein n=1 Tax=Bodo saltans TaxID=75058 RepID=A0A0S4JAJ1_BODSA|nr:Hypothetical protein, putative [Bodo saltans]|eukprot:CUG87153.1 Hypothetical protein, putative [Bodo saltans]
MSCCCSSCQSRAEFPLRCGCQQAATITSTVHHASPHCPLPQCHHSRCQCNPVMTVDECNSLLLICRNVDYHHHHQQHASLVVSDVTRTRLQALRMCQQLFAVGSENDSPSHRYTSEIIAGSKAEVLDSQQRQNVEMHSDRLSGLNEPSPWVKFRV